MTQRTYRDHEIFSDIRTAVIGDWVGFLSTALLLGGLFFVTLHVGVKLGYVLAYFELRQYTPGSLEGRALVIANQLLMIGVGALIAAGMIELAVNNKE